jgi:hypothetical protein
MRELFKNDIIKLAKPLPKLKHHIVYFLLQDDRIVYIGYSTCFTTRIMSHMKDKVFNRYHIVHYENAIDGLNAEKEYIKKLDPKYNVAYSRSLKNPDDFINEKRQTLKRIHSQYRTGIYALDKNLSGQSKSMPFIESAKNIDIEEIEKIIELDEQIEKLNPHYIAKLCDKQLNIANNNYSKSRGVYLFKVNNLVYQAPVGHNSYLIDNKIYKEPKSFIGTLDPL